MTVVKLYPKNGGNCVVGGQLVALKLQSLLCVPIDCVAKR